MTSPNLNNRTGRSPVTNNHGSPRAFRHSFDASRSWPTISQSGNNIESLAGLSPALPDATGAWSRPRASTSEGSLNHDTPRRTSTESDRGSLPTIQSVRQGKFSLVTVESHVDLHVDLLKLFIDYIEVVIPLLLLLLCAPTILSSQMLVLDLDHIRTLGRLHLFGYYSNGLKVYIIDHTVLIRRNPLSLSILSNLSFVSHSQFRIGIDVCGERLAMMRVFL